MSVAHLLQQEVTLYPRASYDAYGKEVVGAGSNIRARVQLQSKMRIQPNSQVQVIDAIAYFDPDQTITINDKVTYNDTDYKVAGIYNTVDGEGDAYYIKVDLMKWQTT